MEGYIYTWFDKFECQIFKDLNQFQSLIFNIHRDISRWTLTSNFKLNIFGYSVLGEEHETLNDLLKNLFFPLFQKSFNRPNPNFCQNQIASNKQDSRGQKCYVILEKKYWKLKTKIFVETLLNEKDVHFFWCTIRSIPWRPYLTILMWHWVLEPMRTILGLHKILNTLNN